MEFFFFFQKVKMYLSSPNSNFPGPFLRKLPLIQVGIHPLIVVGIGSGVSSADCTKCSKLSNPAAFGHRSLLLTAEREETFNISTNLNLYNFDINQSNIVNQSVIWTMCAAEMYCCSLRVQFVRPFESFRFDHRIQQVP